MPEIIQRALHEQPLLLHWYAWGVIAAFSIGLALTVWIFVDAQRTGQGAMVWKSLSAVATVLGIPAILARLHDVFAFQMRDALFVMAGLSMTGVVLVLAAAAAYVATRRETQRCPLCGRPQRSGWVRCPYHPASFGIVETEGNLAPSGATPPITPTLAAHAASVGHPDILGARGSPPKPTVILTPLDPASTLAFLLVISGPHANTAFPLRPGVTRIGRARHSNEIIILDDAVSSNHLSVRYHDGLFVATDLDSSNGTRVNGELITKHTLAPNDVIEIGTTKLLFVTVSEAAVRPENASPSPGGTNS